MTTNGRLIPRRTARRTEEECEFIPLACVLSVLLLLLLLLLRSHSLYSPPSHSFRCSTLRTWSKCYNAISIPSVSSFPFAFMFSVSCCSTHSFASTRPPLLDCPMAALSMPQDDALTRLRLLWLPSLEVLSPHPGCRNISQRLRDLKKASFLTDTDSTRMQHIKHHNSLAILGDLLIMWRRG